jgi:hypothetical protein
MKITIAKTKVLATLGRDIIRTKIVIDDEKREKVSKFKYLRCSISVYGMNKDLEGKVKET